MQLRSVHVAALLEIQALGHNSCSWPAGAGTLLEPTNAVARVSLPVMSATKLTPQASSSLTGSYRPYFAGWASKFMVGAPPDVLQAQAHGGPGAPRVLTQDGLKERKWGFGGAPDALQDSSSPWQGPASAEASGQVQLPWKETEASA